MTSLPYTPPVQGTGIKATIQRFGGQLAGMVMPNITAFIAWGLITALFIPTGWLPNAKLAALVAPMITVLLPLLIGYTGGRMVYGQRGAPRWTASMRMPRWRGGGSTSPSCTS